MHVMNIYLHFDLTFMLLYFHLYSHATLLGLCAKGVVKAGFVAHRTCAVSSVAICHVWCNAIASFVTLNIIDFVVL